MEKGSIDSKEVEKAFRKVKRHAFLQGFVPPEEAYLDQAIMIKGHISSASQPHVMSMMLEMLELTKGHKVLEIGTASGYNAALLVELVGRDDLVYTMEIEADLAERSGIILREQGYAGVTVIAGDGRKGYSIAAPYDRIIITAEADTIYPQLIDQLKDKGILLTPFNFYGLITALIKLESLGEGRYRGSVGGFPVNFVPIRGADIKKHDDRRISHYVHKLMQILARQKLDISNKEMPGLILLLVAWYKSKKLQETRDFQYLIELWKAADSPGINDFDFEYDSAKKDWQLIPIF